MIMLITFHHPCPTFSPESGLTHKKDMATLIRFKMIEIDSCISFTGKMKKTLNYPVRSAALVPEKAIRASRSPATVLPEIFWQ